MAELTDTEPTYTDYKEPKVSHDPPKGNSKDARGWDNLHSIDIHITTSTPKSAASIDDKSPDDITKRENPKDETDASAAGTYRDDPFSTPPTNSSRSALQEITGRLNVARPRTPGAESGEKESSPDQFDEIPFESLTFPTESELSETSEVEEHAKSSSDSPYEEVPGARPDPEGQSGSSTDPAQSSDTSSDVAENGDHSNGDDQQSQNACESRRPLERQEQCDSASGGASTEMLTKDSSNAGSSRQLHIEDKPVSKEPADSQNVNEKLAQHGQDSVRPKSTHNLPQEQASNASSNAVVVHEHRFIEQLFATYKWCCHCNLEIVPRSERDPINFMQCLHCCQRLKPECFNMTTKPPYQYGYRCGHCKNRVPNQNAMFQPPPVRKPWWKCERCGDACHGKCLRNHSALCIGTTTRFCLGINNDPDLTRHPIRCPICDVILPSGPIRNYCDYGGHVSCSSCHASDTSIIPGRISRCADFTPRPVCKEHKRYIRDMLDVPIIQVHMFILSDAQKQDEEDLKPVYKHRIDIVNKLKDYGTCPGLQKTKAYQWLKENRHFQTETNRYTLRELVHLHENSLLPQVAAVCAGLANHVEECVECAAKVPLCWSCRREMLPDQKQDRCSRCDMWVHARCLGSKVCPLCRKIDRYFRVRPEYPMDIGGRFTS